MGKHKEQENLTITSAIKDRWLTLDADTRAQHILSNSNLYQEVQLMESVLQQFRQLEEQHRAASE